jgi:hypothetical protein
MKKKTRSELEKKFRNDKIDNKKLNYLQGGDGDGSQGAIDDPWLED